MLSEKQELYVEILTMLLPFARSVQLWPWYKRIFKSNLYCELELVHNIPPLLKSPGFEVDDAYWLNTQGCNYLSQCDYSVRPFGDTVAYNIEQLFRLLPPDLKTLVTRDPLACLNH